MTPIYTSSASSYLSSFGENAIKQAVDRMLFNMLSLSFCVAFREVVHTRLPDASFNYIRDSAVPSWRV